MTNIVVGQIWLMGLIWPREQQKKAGALGEAPVAPAFFTFLPFYFFTFKNFFPS